MRGYQKVAQSLFEHYRGAAALLTKTSVGFLVSAEFRVRHELCFFFSVLGFMIIILFFMIDLV